MKNHVLGAATTASVASSLHLSTYRRNIMAVLDSLLFTEAERLLANHNVHECEDAQRLALWLHNVRSEAERREEATPALADSPLLTPAATVLHLLPATLVARVQVATPTCAGEGAASYGAGHHLPPWSSPKVGYFFAGQSAQ